MNQDVSVSKCFIMVASSDLMMCHSSPPVVK